MRISYAVVIFGILAVMALSGAQATANPTNGIWQPVQPNYTPILGVIVIMIIAAGGLIYWIYKPSVIGLPFRNEPSKDNAGVTTIDPPITINQKIRLEGDIPGKYIDMPLAQIPGSWQFPTKYADGSEEIRALVVEGDHNKPIVYHSSQEEVLINHDLRQGKEIVFVVHNKGNKTFLHAALAETRQELKIVQSQLKTANGRIWLLTHPEEYQKAAKKQQSEAVFRAGDTRGKKYQPTADQVKEGETQPETPTEAPEEPETLIDDGAT